jgi:hypothetical protein
MIINMKHLSKSILVLLIGSMLMNSSCEISEKEPAYKSDTLLPPITTVGANTFGCKLNGSYWLALPFKNFDASYSKGAISIRLEKSGENTYGIITMSSSSGIVNNIGQYPFNSKFRAYYTTPSFDYAIVDTINTGNFTLLHLDTINRIISGTFEYIPEHLNLLPQKVFITEGRFDLKY